MSLAPILTTYDRPKGPVIFKCCGLPIDSRDFKYVVCNLTDNQHSPKCPCCGEQIDVSEYFSLKEKVHNFIMSKISSYSFKILKNSFLQNTCLKMSNEEIQMALTMVSRIVIPINIGKKIAVHAFKKIPFIGKFVSKIFMKFSKSIQSDDELLTDTEESFVEEISFLDKVKRLNRTQKVSFYLTFLFTISTFIHLVIAAGIISALLLSMLVFATGTLGFLSLLIHGSQSQVLETPYLFEVVDVIKNFMILGNERRMKFQEEIEKYKQYNKECIDKYFVPSPEYFFDQEEYVETDPISPIQKGQGLTVSSYEEVGDTCHTKCCGISIDRRDLEDIFYNWTNSYEIPSCPFCDEELVYEDYFPLKEQIIQKLKTMVLQSNLPLLGIELANKPVIQNLALTLTVDDIEKLKEKLLDTVLEMLPETLPDELTELFNKEFKKLLKGLNVNPLIEILIATLSSVYIGRGLIKQGMAGGAYYILKYLIQNDGDLHAVLKQQLETFLKRALKEAVSKIETSFSGLEKMIFPELETLFPELEALIFPELERMAFSQLDTHFSKFDILFPKKKAALCAGVATSVSVGILANTNASLFSFFLLKQLWQENFSFSEVRKKIVDKLKSFNISENVFDIVSVPVLVFLFSTQWGRDLLKEFGVSFGILYYFKNFIKKPFEERARHLGEQMGGYVKHVGASIKEFWQSDSDVFASIDSCREGAKNLFQKIIPDPLKTVSSRVSSIASNIFRRRQQHTVTIEEIEDVEEVYLRDLSEDQELIREPVIIEEVVAIIEDEPIVEDLVDDVEEESIIAEADILERGTVIEEIRTLAIPETSLEEIEQIAPLDTRNIEIVKEKDYAMIKISTICFSSLAMLTCYIHLVLIFGALISLGVAILIAGAGAIAYSKASRKVQKQESEEELFVLSLLNQFAEDQIDLTARRKRLGKKVTELKKDLKKSKKIKTDKVLD